MSVRILVGDCLDRLAELPTESVHCCVTSPPYYGLRDYGVAGQIGLEATPAEYIETLVTVFREVRRVLRSDGTLWLNIGDSYAGSWGNQGRKEERGTQRPINGPMLQRFNGYPERPAWRSGEYVGEGGKAPAGVRNRDGLGLVAGCKPKDLIGIPWMLAFALRADGWWLRRDIIWAKPNPMPESVTDRCTTAHEYVFMLAKSERYFYDAEAIKEEVTGNAHARGHGNNPKRAAGLENNSRSNETFLANELVSFRNKRSVWTITSHAFPEAHFATHPPALVEPCILAGCPKGGTVLDPFIGAGTAALVADRLCRNVIGIELNPSYAAMTERRLQADAGMFLELAVD